MHTFARRDRFESSSGLSPPMVEHETEFRCKARVSFDSIQIFGEWLEVA
jgi:hypothetical protein